MTGQEVVNLTLTPGTETIIEYPERLQAADVVNYGPGVVYMNWHGSATIGNVGCLTLQEGQTYEIRARYHWQEIHIISASATTIQVVTR